VIRVQQASLKKFSVFIMATTTRHDNSFTSRRQRAPGRLADALADFASAHPDVFAEAAHPFAKLFAAAHGPTVRHILAQTFPASARRLSGLLERAADAAMSWSISARAPAPGTRRGQHARTLVVLVLVQF
jgi:hypothetical protein